VKDKGIFVSAVCPAFVKSEFQQVNNTSDKLRDSEAWYWQTPEEIATESWTRNDKGVEVIVPGFAPKSAAVFMKYLPEGLTRPLTRKAAEQHYIGDGDLEE